MRFSSSGLAALLALSLAACVSRPVPQPAPLPTPAPVPTTPPAPPPPKRAIEAGAFLAAPRTLTDEQAIRGLEAFKLSCPALIRRSDGSGLTLAADWQPLCAEATSLLPTQARSFFEQRFDWVQVADGKAFATGYYEPELAGSRTPLPGYVPIYRTPTDLVRCTKADGTTGRGRVDETGACVLYYSRPEIEDGALANKGLELAWAADPIELFFLQIQGSGRLRQPDGTEMRIGYAEQNGREYKAIGRIMRERGILQPGGTSMQDIVAWLRANPEAGRLIMRENLSYVFFRELTGPGPLGAMNVPVTGRATVAADPLFVPLGAPVFLTTDRVEAQGLWVAQDTGGAIKGSNRFDTFWGHGAEATRIAGGMAAKGSALLLLPRGSLAAAKARAALAATAVPQPTVAQPQP
ncbi:murein transglycosylase A [Sphingomonas rosea]|uniref:peptidoglycan lytic exotransglycosylase n=1 Tax=Sphingomonas rosea TaxID=335605 RepID=A0ABP7THK1_9SPHN